MGNLIKKTALVAIAFAATILVSCSSQKDVTANRVQEDKHHQPTRVGKDDNMPSFDYDAEVTTMLINEARTWLGVPYRWGGNDRNGVDCSGFVLQVYLGALDIKLPRTAATQSDWCTNVKPEALIPGDLVFFDTTKDRTGRVSHVGLYIGEGQMIHASSSKGVIISSIEGNYYSKRLLSAGKVQQYHALVKNGAKPELMAQNTKHKKENAKPKTAEKTQPKKQNEEKPKVKDSTPKPEKKAKESSKEKHKPVPAKPAPAKPAVTTTPQQPQVAQTTVPADPRAAVLQRLKEKKPEQVLSSN